MEEKDDIEFNQKLQDFFKANKEKKRLFIAGDTGSGKSTGTLKYFLGEEQVRNIYYVTTRKADLSEKRDFIINHFKNYTIFLHDKPNSIDKTLGENEEEYKIGGTDKPSHRIHLLTVEKALFLLVIKNRQGTESVINPDLFIFDEIDAISDNQNYEILTAFINTYYENIKTVYISAVVNINHIQKDLKDFFELKNPEKDYCDLGTNNKRIISKFIKMNDSLQKSIEKYLMFYANRSWEFGSAVFILPSIPKIEGIISNKKVMSLGLFKETNNTNLKIKNIENRFSGTKSAKLKPIVRKALLHNFGIINSKIDQLDRTVVLEMFNSGQIPLIISTNSVERGININTKALFLFESNRFSWTNQQIINFYGRINRMKKEKANTPGYFFFISSTRDNYDFNIIKARSQKITSCLDARRAFMFISNFKDMKDKFIDKNIYEKAKSYEKYEKYSDAIFNSLLENSIFPIKSNLDALLKDNNLDKGMLIRDILRILDGEKQTNENVIRYIYSKTTEYLRKKIINITTAKKILVVLISLLNDEGILITFKEKTIPNFEKTLNNEYAILDEIANGKYYYDKSYKEKSNYKRELTSIFSFD